MKTIYKYRIPITDQFTLDLPDGARILTADVQNGIPCLWAEVDTNALLEIREFALVGTGNPRPKKIKTYIATFQQPPYVWHLYELTR